MTTDEKLDKIRENQAYMMPLLADIKKDVYGTEQPGTGLKSRVTALEATRKALLFFVTVGGFLLAAYKIFSATQSG